MPLPTALPVAGPPLEQLVGERTVPQLWAENYWFRRHEIAYRTLAPALVGPGLVLEAGSGEGYGVQLLRRAGVERVVALDYDPAALAHAGRSYPDDVGGRAVRTNLASLPLADQCASAITCLQVLEHLWTPEQFLAECVRVLTPGGALLLSTPNRLTFSPGLGRRQKPPNPFHSREFDPVELRDLIAEQLQVTDLLAVRSGARINAWQAEHGDLVAAQLATGPAAWSTSLRAMVVSITAADFVVGPIDVGPIGSDPTGPDPTGLDDPTVLDLVVRARRR